jgi:hypothetical protein
MQHLFKGHTLAKSTVTFLEMRNNASLFGCHRHQNCIPIFRPEVGHTSQDLDARRYPYASCAKLQARKWGFPLTVCDNRISTG